MLGGLEGCVRPSAGAATFSEVGGKALRQNCLECVPEGEVSRRAACSSKV